MKKNNNIESNQTPNKSNKSGLITTLVLAWSMLFPTLKWQAGPLMIREKANTSKNIFANMKNNNQDTYYLNPVEKIDKDSTAINYLKNNLYINGTNIQDPKLDAKVTKIWEDIYQIQYNHEFEWLPNFSEPTSKKITMAVQFTYKNNNIYISFDDIKIWKYQLEKNWTLYLDNTVYDYSIDLWQDKKTLGINSKANKYKTTEKIIEKIKWNNLNTTKIFKEYPEFENTQLTPLNTVKLWNEVSTEWDKYYREINLIENWKYRPIAKVYFDKYWNIDLTKTNEELNKTNIKVLWIDIKHDITKSDDWLTLTMNTESAKQLLRKVQSDRQAIINIIDKAKIWPNKDFTWFNKEKSVRPWSKQKEVWLFRTDLIWLDLTNDNYTFKRWKEKDQILRFTVESKEWWSATVNMRNWNNQIVNTTFVTIWNDYYQISLNWDVLVIDKIKKEWENITEHMPEYSGDRSIASTITNKTNSHYDGNSLEYFSDEWDLITDINSKKNEKWYYSLDKQSTDIYIMDLYNYKKFSNLTKEIKTYQNKLNTLDINLITAFEIHLEKNWVHLANQDDIRVKDKNWNITYCTIDKKFKVAVDEKMYTWVEKSLTTIRDRLATIDNLCKSKVRWINWSDRQDFEKFVWWWWWIWRRVVSQDQILSFISWATDNIDIELMRWEWQTTVITYNVKKWAIKLNWKSKITISWQEYKIKINKENWDINLNPIEKK